MSPSRTALITGATSGIGHEFARQLAADGWDLILVARTATRLAEVSSAFSRQYGVHVEPMPADLTDRTQLELVEARLAEASRPIDLLVNNAGFGLKHRFLDNDVAQEQQMLDLLVTAVLRLSHAALGPMTLRGSGGIINVSSVAAFLPRGSYSAAKAWVNSFSRWAANEYAANGVTVTAVCPGFVKTEFHERMQVKRGSGFLWLEADRLVREALADHASGKTISIPTRRYRMIVRASRVVPSGLAQRAQRIGRR